MTNFEFYKEKIMEISVGKLAINKHTNEIRSCAGLSCYDCSFYRKSEGCNRLLTEFLYAEHKEQPKLTKKERMLCELYETGYIARDNNGDIGWYANKPARDAHCSRWTDGSGWDNFKYNKLTKELKFDFITWKDEEPWSVEDLLKLEVKEE